MANATSHQFNDNMSVATEHADEDASVATEHSAFDLTTDVIIIGTYRLHWTKASDLQLGTLRALQTEFARRHWVPVTIEDLQAEFENTRDQSKTPARLSKSFSGIVEAISRCVAAFQKARLATEQSEIQWKIIDYAMVLLSRIPPWREPHEYIHALREFVLNRAQNLALISINQQFFTPEAPRPYCLLQASTENTQQYAACVTLLANLNETIETERLCLRANMTH